MYVTIAVFILQKVYKLYTCILNLNKIYICWVLNVNNFF